MLAQVSRLSVGSQGEKASQRENISSPVKDKAGVDSNPPRPFLLHFFWLTFQATIDT